MAGYLTGISPSLRELVTPTVDNFAAGAGFTAGSSTSVTLSSAPGDENRVIVTMDGVTQHHNTFTVSGTTLTFDTAIPSGVANIEARYAQENPNYTTVADNAITNVKMADDAVGLAELSASGTASSSTFLRGDNSWTAIAGGGYEFVGSTDGAGDADVSFTNMAAGYDYLYQWVNLVPVSDNVHFQSQLGIAGPTYRTSNYRGIGGGRHDGGSTDSGEWSSNMILSYNSMGSAANERTAALELTVYDPAESSTITCVGGLMFGHSNVGDEIGNGWFGGYNTATEAITSIKFFFASGNIETGVCKQFRRPNA